MKKIRVLLFKPGIDGHWRGILTVSRALTEAGMEVIFEGFKSVDTIVEAAFQEDVDVIGYSVHSGAHHEWTRRLSQTLDEKGARDSFLIIVGGAIPHADHEALKQEGADAVFSPGTNTKDIVRFIEENVGGAGR
ncbi:MAG: cobalamin-dependent protein [Actinobacteria bacterium]|nr:cobalamin-dependent protein [Actinomycetota bacterium]MBU1944210.1 cobalamin-dependent protein [Actinomycetota bacterium]MBU2688397.1 cobalamin-dependent protein [Actinomycetota bacterium]